MSFLKVTSKCVRLLVLAFAIIALSATADTQDIVPRITQWCLNIWNHLIDTTELPNWILYGLLAIIAITVSRMLLSYIRKVFPVVTSYRQDNFLGVDWHWSYIGRKPNAPWCFCPTCKTELVYSYTGTRADQETELFCEKCNVVKLRYDGDKKYLINNVLRQIKGKILSDNWKEQI